MERRMFLSALKGASLSVLLTSPLTELARAARSKRPSLKLRLLTSSDDYFRDAILELSSAWRAAGVLHDFADVPGPHDYIFNRGPGSIELLTWHDRALARDRPVGHRETDEHAGIWALVAVF